MAELSRKRKALEEEQEQDRRADRLMKRLEAHFGADAEHATPKQLRRRKDASELYATQSETEKNHPNQVERVTKLLVAYFRPNVENATPKQFRRREALPMSSAPAVGVAPNSVLCAKAGPLTTGPPVGALSKGGGVANNDRDRRDMGAG